MQSIKKSIKDVQNANLYVSFNMLSLNNQLSA